MKLVALPLSEMCVIKGYCGLQGTSVLQLYCQVGSDEISLAQVEVCVGQVINSMFP